LKEHKEFAAKEKLEIVIPAALDFFQSPPARQNGSELISEYSAKLIIFKRENF